MALRAGGEPLRARSRHAPAPEPLSSRGSLFLPRRDEPAPVPEPTERIGPVASPGADLGVRNGGSAQSRTGVPLTVCGACLLQTGCGVKAPPGAHRAPATLAGIAPAGPGLPLASTG